MSIPFAYIIISSSGELYVGSRYAINAHPDQLLTTYFTSSRFVEPSAKSTPEKWQIARLQVGRDQAEVIALEASWQREFRDHPGFMNRRIINEGFVYDGSGINNPMSTKWTVQDPAGTVYAQPSNMTATAFLTGLGHSVQMLMKYRKLGELPLKGSFAGWKILSCTRGTKDLLKGIVFTQQVPKSKPRKLPPVRYRGTPEHRAKVAARNKALNAVAAMHNEVSWNKISEKRRANSYMCNGPYLICWRGQDLLVDDLLKFSDEHGLARNTVRHLLKTGLIAKQGHCKGMSIRRQD